MTLILSGTDGLSDVDGTAAAPAIRGTDANTGIFFPAADTIAFSEGGAEAMRIDSSGNVGIGTSSPATRLHVFGAGANSRLENSGATTSTQFTVKNTVGTVTLGLDSSTGGGFGVANAAVVWYDAAQPLVFGTNNTERARIDSSGNLLVGTTSAPSSGSGGSAFLVDSNGRRILRMSTSSTATNNIAQFQNPNGSVGSIDTSGSSTAYVTSSDYRLKHDIQPMTGALARVATLKPVTYKWNADNSESQGFIAHELAEVCPSAVSGEKDAVNEDGSIKPQGIDTSFLVATLTAAIQEQQALIVSMRNELDALKTKVGA
jgi:hypothetical protein